MVHAILLGAAAATSLLPSSTFQNRDAQANCPPSLTCPQDDGCVMWDSQDVGWTVGCSIDMQGADLPPSQVISQLHSQWGVLTLIRWVILLTVCILVQSTPYVWQLASKMDSVTQKRQQMVV